MRLHPPWLLAAALLAPAIVSAACSDDSDAEATAAAGSGAGSAAGGTSGTYTGSGGAPTSIAECQGHVYECGDLQDNDGDGLIDSQDPDCLGPCDNTEDSYFGGIPGQNEAPCRQDCYFDQDSGPGNDGCYWNHKCDPNEESPSYYPEPSLGTQCAYDPDANTPGTGESCESLEQTQSQACLDFCGPLTPNGCDCFGCCELPAGSGEFVWLGSQGLDGDSVCTIASIDDPDLCHPCLPVSACLNGCEPCELCLGKTELPPECGEGGGGGAPPGEQCPEEYQTCGLPGQDPCPSGSYCITGCCVPVPT
jgi:hypothetical protein